jgi:hypothetical protein
MTLRVGNAILVRTHAHTKRAAHQAGFIEPRFTTKLATKITMIWFLWHFIVDERIIAD